MALPHSISARHADEASSADDKTPTARWVSTFASTAHTSSSAPFKPTHSRKASRITVHLAPRGEDIDGALASLQAYALEQSSTDEEMEQLQTHQAAAPALPQHLAVVTKGRPRASTLSDLSDASTVRPSTESASRVRRRSKTLFQARVTAQRRSRAEAATTSPRTPRRISSRRSSVSVNLRPTTPNSVANSEDLDSMDDVLANFAQFIDSGYVSTSSPSSSSASPASKGTSSPSSTSHSSSPPRSATRSLLAELKAWSSSDEDDDDDTDTQTSPAKSTASSRRITRKDTFSTPEASPLIVSATSRPGQILGLPFEGHDSLATLSSLRAIEKLSLQSARAMSSKRTRRSPARRLPPQRDPRSFSHLPLPPPPTPSKAGLSPRFNAHILQQRHAQAMHRQRSGSSVSSDGRSSISYSSYSSSGSSLLCIPGDEEAMALRDGLGSWSFDGEAGSRCATPDSSVSACGSLKPPRPARSPRRPSAVEDTGHFPSAPKHKSRRSRTGMSLPDIKARSASLTATAALVPAPPHTPMRTASLAASPVQEQIRAYRAGSLPVISQESSSQSRVASSPKAPLPPLKASEEAAATASQAPRTPRSDFGSSTSVAEFVAGAEKASKAHAGESLSPERATPRFRERLAGLASLSMRNLSSASLREDAKASPIDDDYVCPSPVPRQAGLSGSLSRGTGMRTASTTSVALDEADEAPPSPRGGFSFLKRPSMSRLGQSSLRAQSGSTVDVSSPMPAPPSPAFRNPFSSDASLLPPNATHEEAPEQPGGGSPSRAPSRLGLSGIGWGRPRKLSAADLLMADFASARPSGASSEDLLSGLRRGSMLGRTLWA